MLTDIKVEFDLVFSGVSKTYNIWKNWKDGLGPGAGPQRLERGRHLGSTALDDSSHRTPQNGVSLNKHAAKWF